MEYVADDELEDEENAFNFGTDSDIDEAHDVGMRNAIQHLPVE